MRQDRIKVENYGDMLATVNDLELVSYKEYGSYQGDYSVILTDGERLFYYMGRYGSCSGCDWLEAEKDWETETVSYKAAVDYCGQIRPKYITPKSAPLTFKYVDGDFKLEDKS